MNVVTLNLATLAAAAAVSSTFTVGQTLVFQPTNPTRFRAEPEIDVTVGPRGVYFGDDDRRWVDIKWPVGSHQIDGGYYVHDFVAKEDPKPLEPTAPMTKAVLDLMRRKGAITQMEAQGVLRCRALPRRIADLKALGHKIVSEMKVDTSGQRYARYHLQREASL